MELAELQKLLITKKYFNEIEKVLNDSPTYNKHTTIINEIFSMIIIHFHKNYSFKSYDTYFDKLTIYVEPEIFIKIGFVENVVYIEINRLHLSIVKKQIIINMHNSVQYNGKREFNYKIDEYIKATQYFLTLPMGDNLPF